MSVRMMTAVWDLPGLQPSEKLVLLKLADCADDTGRNAWPSVHTIAKHCCLARRTVQGALRSLEEGGFIALQHHASSVTKRSTTYRVLVGSMKSETMELPLDADDDAEDGRSEIALSRARARVVGRSEIAHDGRSEIAHAEADGRSEIAHRGAVSARGGRSQCALTVLEPSIEPSITTTTTARARNDDDITPTTASTPTLSAHELYQLHFGHEATKAQAQMLEGDIASHTAECIELMWQRIDGATRPAWPLWRILAGDCLLNGHRRKDGRETRPAAVAARSTAGGGSRGGRDVARAARRSAW